MGHDSQIEMSQYIENSKSSPFRYTGIGDAGTYIMGVECRLSSHIGVKWKIGYLSLFFAYFFRLYSVM